MLLYYTASLYPHGWSINPNFTQRTDLPLEAQRGKSNIMVARIRKDRFASLSAPFRGQIAVDAGSRDEGDSLFINARCSGGRIRVAVSELSSKNALPGFSFEECKPFSGDATRAAITFREARLSDIPATKDLLIHFDVSCGEIFGYDWGTV